MKKISKLLAIITALLCLSICSYAGEWQQDNVGWWYLEDDGSYPANTWKTINNTDYYFGNDGYLLVNTITPDGYIVDANGAKTGVSEAISNQDISDNSVQAATNGNVYLTATGSKYHSIPNCGKTNPANTSVVTRDEAISRGYTACSKCF